MTVKRGRPSKYKDSYPEEIIKLMQQGYKDCQIYAHWKISKDTFYEWLNTYPELKQAHDQGLELCEKWWEDEGVRLMKAGENKSFNYWIAFMNRKFGWHNKNVSGDTNINIQNMNVLQHSNKDRLIEIINEKLGFLKETNVIEADFNLLENKDESSE